MKAINYEIEKFLIDEPANLGLPVIKNRWFTILSKTNFDKTKKN